MSKSIVCDTCGLGLNEGVTLFRINAKGCDGIWRCKRCGGGRADKETAQVVDDLERALLKEAQS